MKLDATFLMVDAQIPQQNPTSVRLAAIEDRSFVAGPGARTVIWVAGCLRRCPNCMKPELFSFAAGYDMTIARLAEYIKSVPEIDGVTFSGGEPFEQAQALAAIARDIHAAGLNVAAYTGYTLEALLEQPVRFGPLLEQVDILIDGEYRDDLDGPFPMRGSTNQRIHDFSNLMENRRNFDESRREVQVSVRGDRLRLTGFPDSEMETALRGALREKGIVLESNR